jgi:hypothetical protein
MEVMNQLSAGNKKADRAGYCETGRKLEPMLPLKRMNIPQETAFTVLIMAFSMLQTAPLWMPEVDSTLAVDSLAGQPKTGEKFLKKFFHRRRLRSV